MMLINYNACLEEKNRNNFFNYCILRVVKFALLFAYQCSIVQLVKVSVNIQEIVSFFSITLILFKRAQTSKLAQYKT